MYVSSIGRNPQILRADMDGKNQILLANLSFLGQTYVDIVLDMPGNRLFFSDQSYNMIRYIGLASMEIHTLLSENVHRPTGLAILNNTLYWASGGDGRFAGAIFKAEATNGSTAQMIADGLSGDIKAIYMYSALELQPPGKRKDQ